MDFKEFQNYNVYKIFKYVSFSGENFPKILKGNPTSPQKNFKRNVRPTVLD